MEDIIKNLKDLNSNYNFTNYEAEDYNQDIKNCQEVMQLIKEYLFLIKEKMEG